MSLTPQFSDALTSHFAASGDSSRASSSPPTPLSPTAFTRQPNEATASSSATSQEPVTPGTDRRQRSKSARASRAGMERRQFGSSHSGLSAEGRDLATAIDAYKLEHRRRYITCDEMLLVLRTLGYDKTSAPEESQ